MCVRGSLPMFHLLWNAEGFFFDNTSFQSHFKECILSPSDRCFPSSFTIISVFLLFSDAICSKIWAAFLCFFSSIYLTWHLCRLGNRPRFLLCLAKCLFVPSHQKTHKGGEKDLSHPFELITEDISGRNYEKKNSYAEVNAFSHCSCKALLQIKHFFFTLIKALVKIEKAVSVSGLSEKLSAPPPLREVPPPGESAQCCFWFLFVSFPAGGDGVLLLMAFIGVNTVLEKEVSNDLLYFWQGCYQTA